MLTSVIPTRLPARRIAVGSALAALGFGCTGDNLLLPRDGAPAELRIVSGDQQSAPAGDRVREPLVVEARDGVGRPVRGAVVVFDFVDPPIGAEIGPDITETDTAGRASVQVKLGTPAGNQDVEARLDDPASELAVRFRLTALQPKGGGGGGGGRDGDGGNGGRGGGGSGGGGDGTADDDGQGAGGGDNKGKGEGRDDDKKGKGKGKDKQKDEGKGKDKDKDKDHDD